MEYLLEHWPVCQDCLAGILGVANKRIRKYRADWEESGRQLKRVESKHKRKTRASPMQYMFRDYLDQLAEVYTSTIYNVFCH